MAKQDLDTVPSGMTATETLTEEVRMFHQKRSEHSERGRTASYRKPGLVYSRKELHTLLPDDPKIAKTFF